jgi:hypothetical protein
MSRQVLAAFDEQGVFVYQAFRPTTVEAALAKGTFGAGFSLDRMTWIKPSFGWMLYRSGYATKHGQERILKIKLLHDGFRAVLGRGVPTTFDPTNYADVHDWRSALDRSEVRFQWDPDRDLKLVRLERRAVQLGIEGATVRQYVNEWIVGLEDATPLAKEVQAAVEQGRTLPAAPEERPYPLDAELARRLGVAG